MTRKQVATLKERFFAAFGQCGFVTQAAAHAKIQRVQYYQWLRADTGYAEGFAEAGEIAIETLEREVRRRAMKAFSSRWFINLLGK